MSEPLGFDDAKILRLESDSIMAHTVKGIVIAPAAGGDPLSAAAVRERIAERIDGLPRLSQRVVEPTSGEGLPEWVDDSPADLAWHVREAPPGDPLDDAGFRLATSGLMGERLDHTRPLWQLDVMELTDGRVGLVMRIHHAMADGVTAIRTLGEMLWDVPAKAGDSPALKPGAAAGGHRLTGKARTAARLPSTLHRELRRGPDSRLDRHIGSRREVAWRSFPLADLKEIEHAAGEGTTVNDVVLAVVAGAMRTWIAEEGEQPERLRVMVPVCMHSRDEKAGAGNRDSFLYLDLPADEPDPAARLAMISAESRARKLAHDAETLYAFFHALARFKPLHRGVTRLVSGPREFALSVSNVPGPRESVFIDGRPVQEFFSFAEPADRHALRVSVVSLGGELAFGLCSDPDAVPGIDRFADALPPAVAELSQT